MGEKRRNGADGGTDGLCMHAADEPGVRWTGQAGSFSGGSSEWPFGQEAMDMRMVHMERTLPIRMVPQQKG